MAGQQGSGVDERGPSLAGRAARAAASFATRKGAKHARRAALAKATAAAGQAAASNPVGWAIAGGVAAALLAAAVVLVVVVAVVVGSAGSASAACRDGGGCASGEMSAFAIGDIPVEYLALYQRAADTYRIDWAVLAAIGKVETDHGRLDAPGVTSGQNSHGCCAGPMQFHNDYGRNTPGSTWMRMRVDGNRDGVYDIYDPADAIPSAARYLKVSLEAAKRRTPPGGIRDAIFAYNHANWYVDKVLALAEQYRAPAGGLGVVPRLDRLITVLDQIEAQGIPYCYGGGHGVTPARPTRTRVIPPFAPGVPYCWEGKPAKQIHYSDVAGLDCSSSVSLALQSIGYDLTTMTSTSFQSWGEPGRGRYVTVWASNEHVFMTIAGRNKVWETSSSNYQHGPGWSPREYATSYDGYTPRHPPGL